MKDEPKKLYRLPKQGKIAGVAAGLAEYFAIDVTLMRILFVVAAVITEGLAILAYIIAIFVMPTPESDDKPADKPAQATPEMAKDFGSQAGTYIGIGLIIIGAWLLAGILLPGIFEDSWRIIWPLLITALGIWIIKGSKK